MPLLGNYSVLLKSAGRFRSGSTVSDNRAAFNAPNSARGFFCSQAGIPATASIPDGYKPGAGAWVIPIKGGGMSSFSQSTLALTGTMNLAAGRNIDGSTTLTISVPDAALQLIVSATGTATLTLTSDGALVGAVAGSGTASLSFAASPALLGALAGIAGTAQVTLTPDATIRALGVLAGDILPYTELSPESLAAAVRDVVIEGQYTLAELLRIISAAVAGKVSGGPGSPVFRDLNDTTDRIAGTADADGNRTAVTYDVD